MIKDKLNLKKTLAQSGSKIPRYVCVRKFLSTPLKIIQTTNCGNSKGNANTTKVKKSTIKGNIKKKIFKCKSLEEPKNESTPKEVDIKPFGQTKLEDQKNSDELEISTLSEEFKVLEKAYGINTPQKSINDKIEAAIQIIDNLVSEAKELKKILVSILETSEVENNVPNNNLLKDVRNINIVMAGIKKWF